MVNIELSENGIKNWSWQIKKPLMYVRIPDLCNMVQLMDYSFEEISILIKKNLAHLANEHWVVRLHRPTSDSVTGGKLRTIKAEPNPSPYLLAPLGPGQ